MGELARAKWENVPSAGLVLSSDHVHIAKGPSEEACLNSKQERESALCTLDGGEAIQA